MRQTTSQQQAAKREQALTDIRKQVRTGSLTIRQMTAEERARYASPGPVSRRSRPAR